MSESSQVPKQEKFRLFVNNDPPIGERIAYPDTEEGWKEAIRNGAKHASVYAYDSKDPKNTTPVRYGDLALDFDIEKEGDDPYMALKVAQNFVDVLKSDYGVEYDELEYFLSGKKGAYVIIPDILIGCENGDKNLPLIHEKMIKYIFESALCLKNNVGFVDFNQFYMGEGHFNRIPNIRRDIGTFKVPLLPNEFMSIVCAKEMAEYVKEPRYIRLDRSKLVRNEKLFDLYLKCKENSFESVKSKVKATETMTNECEFIQYCKDKATEINYTQWTAMLSNFAHLGITGYELGHLYSSLDSNRYKKNETQQKLDDFKTLNAYSCAKINSDNLFTCTHRCNVQYPYQKFLEKTKVNNQFMVNNDGLHLFDPATNTIKKISSYIEVIAYTCDIESKGWGRIIRLSDPKGIVHQIILSMEDLMTSPENTLKKLMNNGLQLESYRKCKEQVFDYIISTSPDKFATIVKKTGWVGKVYVMKNAIIGANEGELFELDSNYSEGIMSVSGSLDEWKENVASFCKNQYLFILALSYAFTGFVLTPCNYEGGGLHIFGGSSTGKTTALVVAGSVCGGGHNGYIDQWRSTDNAFEATAFLHNDGFLALDEIGQATSKVISESSYLFTNGSGKRRMSKSENVNREMLTWRLSFMSTGELTLGDAIALDGKKEAKAGQEVRIIDVPADYSKDYKAFDFIPEGYSAAQFSDLLKTNARKFYGSAAITFIEKFAENFEDNVEWIKEKVKKFIQDYLPDGASGEVTRGCQRFAITAACGEKAIEWEILPFEPGEAEKAAKIGFEKWIKQRGGLGEKELTNAIQRMKDFIQTNDGQFLDLNEPNKIPSVLCGYKWHDNRVNDDFYGFIPSVFDEKVCRSLSRKSVVEELIKLNYLAMTFDGKAIPTKSVNGKTQRVITVRPSMWSGKCDYDGDLPISDKHVFDNNVF